MLCCEQESGKLFLELPVFKIGINEIENSYLVPPDVGHYFVSGWLQQST